MMDIFTFIFYVRFESWGSLRCQYVCIAFQHDNVCSNYWLF